MSTCVLYFYFPFFESVDFVAKEVETQIPGVMFTDYVALGKRGNVSENLLTLFQKENN